MATHNKREHTFDTDFAVVQQPMAYQPHASYDGFGDDDDAQRRRREERRKRKKQNKRGKATSFEEGDPDALMSENGTRKQRKKKRTRQSSWVEEVDEFIDTGKARGNRGVASNDEWFDDVDA
ncbi:MAG: hypothetical protein AAFR81_09255 [Chloroflexota bacterium]